MMRFGVPLLLCLTVLSTAALAQEDVSKYPSKAVSVVVIFGAGGPTDVPARKIASLMEKEFNQAFVVDNKLGGAGVVGLTTVARAKPDGYTIGTFSYSPTVVAPHVRAVPFDTTKDFTPIAQFADYAQPFCVNKDTPWKSVNEVMEFARQHPGQVTYSTVGAGSGQHIFMEALAKRENVKLTHVPFRGGAEGVAALLGGHVKAALAAEVASHARTGECRPLAVASAKRLASLPSVPTFAELGVKIDPPLWLGFAGPAGLPDAIVKKLDQAVAKALKDPGVLQVLEQFVLTPVYRDHEEFKKLVLRDFDRERELIKELGLGKQP